MTRPQPFDPLTFLAIARALAMDSSNEGRLRTAIGRAYYGVFLVVRDWLGVHEHRDAHQRVLTELGNRNQQGIGARLHDLRALRMAADYQLVPHSAAMADWEQNWRDAEKQVRWLVNRLQQLGVLAPE